MINGFNFPMKFHLAAQAVNPFDPMLLQRHIADIAAQSRDGKYPAIHGIILWFFLFGDGLNH